mmetsp:Transcript_30880/g.56554  ORF Transcript_30880/g.56554 Transcript_30880/m.56554 type:complete len:263 (-) Transcript_30880:202-990(-)
MDNIPFNGIVNDGCAQSVISEISERTGGALDGSNVVYNYSGDNNNNDSNSNNNISNNMSHTDAVKALLREGMESARQKHAASTDRTKQQRSLAKIRESSATTNSGSGGSGGSKHSGSHSRNSRNTHTTARSTIDSCNGNNNSNSNNSNSSKPHKKFLDDIHHTYAKFKTDRNGGKDENGNRSILTSIIEDVQFCGLYFCGIDTTIDNWGDGHSRTGDEKYDELMKKRREDRKRATDDTFLGKVISCGDSYGCGNGTAFCVAL